MIYGLTKEAIEMIKPETVKIVTYSAARGNHSMWYVLSGNGGDTLNKHSRRLVPVVCEELSNTNIGGMNKLSKEFHWICKKSYHNYRRPR